jgi:hypothetical protein
LESQTNSLLQQLQFVEDPGGITIPRCKALVRGGSRRCKRNALKGSMYCSQCGGRYGYLATSPHNNNNKGISSRRLPLPNASRGPSHSEDKLSSRLTLNPAFRQLSMDNPLVQHFIADKVGDISRTANVGVAANVATMPMLYGGGPGLAAKVGTSILATIVIGGYMNTMDQYRDLASFAVTGKIHGHSVIGRTHQ